MSQSYQSRYNAPLMFLHWLVFILIVSTYAVIKVRGYLPEDDSMRASLMMTHKSIGVALFVLIVCRLLVRWTSNYPPISPPVSKTYHRFVLLAHYAIYALLLIMPITGYIMSSAAGREVVFLDWVLPNVIGKDEALSRDMYNFHVWSSQAIYVLVGIHILMALWHHFVRKDNALICMMPKQGASDKLQGSVKSTPLASQTAVKKEPKPKVKPTVAKPKAVEKKAKAQAKPKSVTETKVKAATKPKAAVKPKTTATKPKTATAKPKAAAKPRAKPAEKPKAEPKT